MELKWRPKCVCLSKKEFALLIVPGNRKDWKKKEEIFCYRFLKSKVQLI